MFEIQQGLLFSIAWLIAGFLHVRFGGKLFWLVPTAVFVFVTVNTVLDMGGGHSWMVLLGYLNYIFGTLIPSLLGIGLGLLARRVVELFRRQIMRSYVPLLLGLILVVGLVILQSHEIWESDQFLEDMGRHINWSVWIPLHVSGLVVTCILPALGFFTCVLHGQIGVRTSWASPLLALVPFAVVLVFVRDGWFWFDATCAGMTLVLSWIGLWLGKRIRNRNGETSAQAEPGL